jgi:hypothetical protein
VMADMVEPLCKLYPRLITVPRPTPACCCCCCCGLLPRRDIPSVGVTLLPPPVPALFPGSITY